MWVSVCSYLSSLHIPHAVDRKAMKEWVDNITLQETLQRTVMLTLFSKSLIHPWCCFVSKNFSVGLN